MQQCTLMKCTVLELVLIPYRFFWLSKVKAALLFINQFTVQKQVFAVWLITDQCALQSPSKLKPVSKLFFSPPCFTQAGTVRGVLILMGLHCSSHWSTPSLTTSSLYNLSCGLTKFQSDKLGTIWSRLLELTGPHPLRSYNTIWHQAVLPYYFTI